MTHAQERAAEQARQETEDFTQFWDNVRTQESGGKVLRNVFGIDVQLPTSLPLRFEMEARRLAMTEDDEEARRMVGYLFGNDALDHWIEQGCDTEQFGVLLMWGSANASGHDMSLSQAREEYRKAIQAKAARPGQAPGETAQAPGPNRAERRAGPMPGLSSSNTGAPLSPTFDVSTGSAEGSWPTSQPGSSDFWSAVSPNSPSGGPALPRSPGS